MTTVISVNNDLNEIHRVLVGLKESIVNVAYISYIEGEYGMRVFLYKTLVQQFVNKQRDNNNKIIGFCFKGTTCFMKEYCDIILELNTVKFNTEEYSGTDGWNIFYLKGAVNQAYEDMIDSLKFSNIFYTARCDGASTHSKNITMSSCTNDMYPFALLNNNEMMFNLELGKFWGTNHAKPIKTTEKSDNIAIFIRNTNKWPERNMPSDIYTALFNYCIANKKHLYIFLDLIPVDIPESEFLHCPNIREGGLLLIDEIINICNKSYIFIGADSGITEICELYSKTNVLCTSKGALLRTINTNQHVYHSGILIHHLNSLYNA